MNNDGERRFHAGERFRIPPMDYRVTEGKKADDDLRLDWRYNDGRRISPWWPVVLDHVALIIDIIADNENALYPPPAAGGAYVVRFVRQAFKHGWRQACDELLIQRMNKGRIRG